jgi:hypothetical protein
MTATGAVGRLTGMTTTPRATSFSLLGGTRLNGPLQLPKRLLRVTTLGGIDADLTQAELAPEGVEIVKVSLLGGVSLVIPAHVRVEVQAFALIGGKDVERRPDLPADAPVVRVRSFGLLGGVRVRVAAAAA